MTLQQPPPRRPDCAARLDEWPCADVANEDVDESTRAGPCRRAEHQRECRRAERTKHHGHTQKEQHAWQASHYIHHRHQRVTKAMFDRGGANSPRAPDDGREQRREGSDGQRRPRAKHGPAENVARVWIGTEPMCQRGCTVLELHDVELRGRIVLCQPWGHRAGRGNHEQHAGRAELATIRHWPPARRADADRPDG